jgi:hypothetical protein
MKYLNDNATVQFLIAARHIPKRLRAQVMMAARGDWDTFVDIFGEAFMATSVDAGFKPDRAWIANQVVDRQSEALAAHPVVVPRRIPFGPSAAERVAERERRQAAEQVARDSRPGTALSPLDFTRGARA